MAVRGGRILAVGADAEIEALSGRHAERIDLQGLTATHGLLDAHDHFPGGAAHRLFWSLTLITQAYRTSMTP